MESTIDQMRHPGMKRTWLRSPDRLKMNMAPRLPGAGGGKDGSH